MQKGLRLAGLTRRGMLGVLGGAGLAGCSALERPTQAEIAAERPDRPTMILVKNFAAGPSEVDITRASGTTAAKLVSGSPRTLGELEIGHTFAVDVTAALVAQLQALGLPAQPASAGPGEGRHPVFVEGQFISVAATSAGEPQIVGFRAGYPDVFMDIQLFDHNDDGDVLLEGVETSITRGPDPVATTLLPAQVLDHAGGVAGLSPEDTARLKQGADATAKLIMAQLRPIFKNQGWIS